MGAGGAGALPAKSMQIDVLAVLAFLLLYGRATGEAMLTLTAGLIVAVLAGDAATVAAVPVVVLITKLARLLRGDK